jgi:integrase
LWYVRLRREGLASPRFRVEGQYGSAEFMDNYRAALRAAEGSVTLPPRSKQKLNVRSLAWLIARYRESEDWKRLAEATRRQRENLFKPIVTGPAGERDYREITAVDIREGRDRRAHTPAQSLCFLKAMRGLFQWASSDEAGYLQTNPTIGVKPLPLPKGDGEEGFRTWTEEEIAAFEARWPIGTRERVAFAVLICTGLRRGDAARLGPEHVRGDQIVIRTEKTKTLVAIPMLPELNEVLAAGPVGSTTFIAGAKGAPMVKEAFGNWFKDACVAAGVTDASAHGLRKAAAVRLAMGGATVPQLNAVFGWNGSKMAMKYIDAADRARLAHEAFAKLKTTRYSRTLSSGLPNLRKTVEISEGYDAESGSWCPGAESNHRHCDFQSHALPTELPGPALGAWRGL